MRFRHMTLAVAVSVVTPILVVSPLSPSAEAEPTPVNGSQQQVDFVAPSDPRVGDAVTAPRSTAGAPGNVAGLAVGPRVLGVTPERAVPQDLALIGVTWRNDTGDGATVQYRTQNPSGRWGEWTEAQVEKSPEGERSSARAGTDPIVVTGAAKVQARVIGLTGDTPADPELSLIDPGESPADEGLGGTQPGSAQAAAARPNIISRSQWGANESWRKSNPSYGIVKGAIVHHTSGGNDYSPDQVPGIMRGIYAFHTKDRGWSDVGYNFLVDKWGRVWEGRYGGTTRAVVGAHTSGFNGQTMGISVMGDYERVAIPEAAVKSVERVIAWKAGIHGFDPTGRTNLYGRNLPTIIGHLDVGNTDCPGKYFYPLLPRMRTEIKAMTGRGVNVPPAATRPDSSKTERPDTTGTPVTGVGVADVLMRSSSKELLRSTATTGDVSFASTVSGPYWASYDHVVAAGDLDGDGRGDVLGRVGSTGHLVFFKGLPGGGLSRVRTIGKGWQDMSSITPVGDVTGDGRPDIAALSSTGRLIVYPGRGDGSLGTRILHSRGWAAGTKVTNVGDWNLDGRGDLFAARPDGSGMLLAGNGRGGMLKATKVHGEFGRYRTLAGLPSTKAILGVDASGKGWIIKRRTASTVRTVRATPDFTGVTVYGS